MGTLRVASAEDPAVRRAFMARVVEDLHRLGELLDAGVFETGVRRAGVEQEMILVGDDLRPFPLPEDVLADLPAGFTTELARYNLEANLEPRRLEGSVLRDLERDLSTALATAERCAGPDAAVVLTGTLPTLAPEDLRPENLTPLERYRELDRSLRRLCGDTFTVSIRGVDRLEITHDNIVLQSANTALQLHLQVDPEEFATRYDLAQLISAPLLAASANSPVLLGRRLWHETRVALFEEIVVGQTRVDVNRPTHPRVAFGRDWLRGSILELLQEEAARHPTLLVPSAEGDDEDSAEALPGLEALSLHNGTVWLWNRGCFETQGTPHLRIENRVLPSGPTLVDEVANAALFYGLMLGLDGEYLEVADRLPFQDAKGNFLAAARNGLQAGLTWLDRRPVTARDLIADELLPCAETGLRRLGVDEEDIQRYLGVMQERVRTGQTGAQWTLDSLTSLRARLSRDAALHRVTAAMLEHQRAGDPVHTWELASPRPAGSPAAPPCPRTAADVMTSDVYTVAPDQVVDLAAGLLEWQHLRYVPVEDDSGRVVGLVTEHHVLEALHHSDDGPRPVREIMSREVPAISPELPIEDAMRALLAGELGCLVVVSGGLLQGIVTARDLLGAALERLEGR